MSWLSIIGTPIGTEIHLVPRTRASQKGLLDGAGDPPGFQRRDYRSCVFLLRCASQFDPTIDKERKFISNLRWNMPICAQTVSSVPLREQPGVKSD